MENKQQNAEQTINLINKKELFITGANKIISLKPDLIQLNTVNGGLIIEGENLELVKLDNQNARAEIKGEVNAIKFTEVKTKRNFFRKIFKWFLAH